jgi:diguanylate cyclase (GGDEF)-like protein/PAS domain S-box-containing protein
MGVVLSKSLFIKQAILILILAVFLSLLSSVVQVVESVETRKGKINSDFDELLAVVEKPLAEALFRLDMAFAQQQVDSMLSSPSIAHIEVRDESGVLLIESKAAIRHFSVSQSLADYFLSDLQEYKRDLRMDAPKFYVGTLSVEPEKRFLMDNILAEHLSILTYNLFKDVLLASLISLVFYLLVTYPLTRLTDALSTLNLNSTLSLPSSFFRYHKADELGRLHSTFTQLLKKLNIALSDLERSDSHNRAMIEHAADGILLLDQSHKITRVNTAAERMLGMNSTDIISSSLENLFTPSSWPVFSRVLKSLQVMPQTVEAAYQIEGAELPVEIRLAKYTIKDKVEILLLVRDVSERKEAEAHIHQLAYYDSITNLPNRQYLIEQLNRLLDQGERQQEFSAVVFMDLDRFKVINDSLGHSAGDQLLRCVATQLSKQVEGNITLVRMGGDEFAFLLTYLGMDKKEVTTTLNGFIEGILQACQQVKKAGHHDVHITASLGATLFNNVDGSAEMILKQADTALYRAKESGRNTFAFYEPEMQIVSDARLEMEKALHHATEYKLFELYYQPQVNHKNQLIGAEALIRWKDEHKGFISPAEFIPIAEDIGLIVEIGEWVLNEALSQVATWLREGKWQLSWRMSINVSPIQFQQASFLPMLKAQLEKHDVPSYCVDLEITENMLLNNLSSSLDKMNEIKTLGVYLSIDDFGTGYSSLKYLKSLPINRLKIDQSFVRDLLTDKSDEAIVLAIIAMANALNINVLAEGVEVLAQHDRLQEIHCYYYQGYHFGRPVPPSQFMTDFIDKLSVSTKLIS